MDTKKKPIAILQARMGSSRLPGKVMSYILRKPVIQHILERVQHSKLIHEIIVATTTKKEDDVVVALCSKLGIKSFRGSEEDVLDRYYKAAKFYKADSIVRITADCPLIDPRVMDRVIGFYLNHNFDYVSITIKPTYPDGLDTEVFNFSALERAWKEATLGSEREHVTPFIKNADIFKIKNLENDTDLSRMRWTIDQRCDLEFVQKIYEKLYSPKADIFYMEDIIDLLNKYPQLKEINRGLKRDEGYLVSLEKDKVEKYKNSLI